jgi:hypothetical protein
MVRAIREVRYLVEMPLLFTLLCLAFAGAWGQDASAFKTQDPGKGFVEVGGDWRFHTGDDLQWAVPGYDDSGWELLRGDKTWGAQTHPSYVGFAWYRKRIEVTPGNAQIGLLVRPVDDIYELYWNGKKIGSDGQMPPHAHWDAVPHGITFSLPSSSGVLAVRVWKSPLASVDPASLGGFEYAPRIGDADYLSLQTKAIHMAAQRRALPALITSSLMAVTGLLALLVFLRERKKWLYLWLAVYLVAIGVRGVDSILRTASDFFQYQLLLQTFDCAADLALWAVLLSLFGLDQEKRWRRVTFVLAGLYVTSQVVDMTALFFWEHAGKGMVWVDAISTAVYTILPLYMVAILIAGLRRRRQLDLWPLAFIVFITGMWVFAHNMTGQGPQIIEWKGVQAWMEHVGFSLGDYRFDMRAILQTLVFVAMVFTVAREQYLERRRQARMEMEVRSAREVQQVLVPETVPTVPGFAIDSVYKPAAELGGDFFQVISLPDASILIVIGDVSGKGLKAAMTVSLIVGTLRTLIDYTQEPTEILQGMNRRLFGRVQDGFATCVVLRLKPNGEATIANAGHLAPFRDGEELPLRGSLPLGLSAEAAYEELVFRLHEGETLTLYTDGIVEARSATGELYGFERVQILAQERQSAEQIVAAACAFGQEDDITVLSIRRLAASEERDQARVSLTAQIATV